MTTRVEPTPLPGVFLLHSTPTRDDRGSFERLSCLTTLADHGIAFTPRQVSLSRTPKRGTLRGMHFQRPPSAETKLIHCLAGAVFDVLVDLRPGSPTFRQTFTAELSAENGAGVLAPPGCAHAALTLTDNAAVLYQIDRDYDPSAASGVRWNDPAFSIAWPFPPRTISARDAAWPDFLA
jgi:dTDP-4-dehydrorhamnose 3,5-epimerase